MHFIFPLQFEWSFPNVNQLYPFRFLLLLLFTRQGPARKQTILKSRCNFMLKVDYAADERAKKSKKECRGNPEISNSKRKGHHHPKQGGTKGNMVIAGAQRLKSPSRSISYIQPVQREMRPQADRVAGEHAVWGGKNMEKHPDFGLPTTIQFSNSTSLWPNPARSQRLQESGKYSLQGQTEQKKGRAVKGAGAIRLSTGWPPFWKLDSVPVLKPSAQSVAPCYKRQGYVLLLWLLLASLGPPFTSFTSPSYLTLNSLFPADYLSALFKHAKLFHC